MYVEIIELGIGLGIGIVFLILLAVLYMALNKKPSQLLIDTEPVKKISFSNETTDDEAVTRMVNDLYDMSRLHDNNVDRPVRYNRTQFKYRDSHYSPLGIWYYYYAEFYKVAPKVGTVCGGLKHLSHTHKTIMDYGFNYP